MVPLDAQTSIFNRQIKTSHQIQTTSVTSEGIPFSLFYCLFVFLEKKRKSPTD